MNKEIYDKAEALNEWILSQEAVIEFKKLEKYIEEHDELRQLEESLKQMQQDIVNKKHLLEDTTQLIEDYQNAMDAFSSHPIIHNYLLLKTEVNELLITIEEDIKKQLDKRLTE